MSRMTTHHPRAARLTSALVIAVGALATLAASPATAGVVTHAYKAAVRTPGLSAAERRAISVKSITATADDSLGVLVSVQLQGDLERSLGRGGLADGLLALALVPKGCRGHAQWTDRPGWRAHAHDVCVWWASAAASLRAAAAWICSAPSASRACSPALAFR